MSKSKLVNTLGILSIATGSALILKGFTDDLKYEDKMIKKGKTEYFEDSGAFKDRNNAREYLAGVGLLIAGLGILNYKKKN